MTSHSTQLPPSPPSMRFGGRTPYVRYTDADVLASLIHPETSEPQEVTFIAATQIMELHFTLLIHDLGQVITELDRDDVPAALATLRRVHRDQDSLVSSWDLLAELTPTAYNRFRDQLGSASGFQSFGYRNLEFLLGVKSVAQLRPHSGMPAVHDRLAAALAAPSVYDAALAALSRQGIDVPADVVGTCLPDRAEADARLVAAWQQVYALDGPLRELADSLTGVAERHSRWRFVHFTAVRRILGTKPGTGGSAGLTWLKRAVDAPVFVDLWEVRSVL